MKNVILFCFLLIHISVQGQNADVFKLIKNDKIDEIKSMLSTDRNIAGQVNNKEQTPLIYAAKLDKSDIVDLLINTVGVKISAKDKSKKTALDYAKENGNTAMVCRLELATAIFEKDTRLLRNFSQKSAKQCNMESQAQDAIQKVIADEYYNILTKPTIYACNNFIKKYEGFENPYLPSAKNIIDSLVDVTAKESGLEGLIKLEGSVGNIWNKIGAYISQHGELLAENDAVSVNELYDNIKASNVASIKGATYMGTTPGKTTFIPNLYFIKNDGFLYFKEGDINYKSYKNICLYRGKSYKIN